MHNALKVLSRDFGRILRAPKVWVIVIGLIVIPALYAWVNIIAFWDPYSNTQDVKVAIVNLDEGTTSELTGELNVGDKVVAQLKENDQLGWQFLSEDEAMKAVKSGDSYAAIVIPKTFSADLLSIASGHFVRPELDYYVNEKANAIAPKITGVGATTLQTQVNSTFVSTVAKTLAEELEKAGVTIGGDLINAKDNSLLALDDASNQLSAARSGLEELSTSLVDVHTAISDTQSALNGVNATMGEIQASVADTQALLADAQQELLELTDTVTNASVAGSILLANASSQLNSMITTVLVAAKQANVEVGSAIADAKAVADATAKSIDRLEQLLSVLDPSDPAYQPLSDALGRLQERADANAQLLANLQALNSDITATTSAIQASADAANAAIQNSANASSAVRTVIMDTLPALNRAMSTMSASAGALSSALDAQRTLISESVGLLGGLDDQLTQTAAAIASLDSDLGSAQDGLANLSTDVQTLSSAQVWSKVQALTGLDPAEIADFMTSPVTVKEHAVFPVKTYGSAMAPLFTNLSLWIGAFVLVVLLKQEADTEGIPGLTVRQAFLGRWMMLAILAVLQALLVSTGNIVIGVQMVSPVAFVATSVFVSLVYMAIIYALAASFGYIGKGVIILLVIMQIPGASGIYPIEMMPPFFQALFPLFPFTYSIDAMRETIGGFYDLYFVRSLAMLALFAVLAFFLGLFLRQRLGNFARLFNRNLADTGLFISEDVQILGSRRRLSQIVQALTDKQAFRLKTARRAAWLDKHHMTLLTFALLIGVALTVLLAIWGFVVPDAKATVVGLWALLCLLMIAFVVTVEYIKQNIVFAGRVGTMPTPELQRELVREELATHSNAALDALREQE